MQPAVWSAIDREFAEAVREGLTGSPKTLPARYLYDELGSALFEAITCLPEYGLTRSDVRVLQQAARWLGTLQAKPVEVIELGSGTGRKTRAILDALPGSPYWAIDVSPAALAETERQLQDHDVRTLPGAYLEMLPRALEGRPPYLPVLVLFLGSTIGNFSPAEAEDFLAALRERLRPGDLLLLGADLVKAEETMLAAYDDPAGVTAAFNRNLLGRINRELGANFDLRAFRHEARWDDEESRVEMHLCAEQAMRVDIPGAGCSIRFVRDETIWTESSYKFSATGLDALAVGAGFHPVRTWVDAEWPFAECLWRVTGSSVG